MDAYRSHHCTWIHRVLIDVGLIIGLTVGIIYSKMNMLAVELRTAMACALAIGWLWHYDSLLASCRMLGPLRWCGAMCYSLYLTHWPVCKLLSHGLYVAGVNDPWYTLCFSIPLSVMTSLGVSYLFFLAVERRFLNASAQT